VVSLTPTKSSSGHSKFKPIIKSKSPCEIIKADYQGVKRRRIPSELINDF
jgi:hypothetical protein